MTPWTIQSMEFSKQEYWNALLCPPPGGLPSPGIRLPRSPTLHADSLPAEPQGKPKNTGVGSLSFLQGIFPTHVSNWGLLHCRQILYQLRYQRSQLNLNLSFFFSFIFISWRLITLQYCSGFFHTLTWISHGFTCVPHPDTSSRLPLYPIPLGLPSAPGPSTCLMHPAWAGGPFHPR